MKKVEKFYPETRFGGFTDIDGLIIFYTRINALLKPSDSVLDVGCGRSTIDKDVIPYRKKLRIIRGKVKKVIGIDIDKEAERNPYIDEFRLIQGETWPVEDESIDLLISSSVLEHVANPDIFFSEAHRILRPNGYICLNTPNQWGYVAFIAKNLPSKFHAKILKFSQGGRHEEDVFPTLYRCNSIRKIRRMMTKYGFDSVIYGYEHEPSYFAFSMIAYYMGVLHQKFSPKCLKTSIFAFGRKLPVAVL